MNESISGLPLATIATQQAYSEIKLQVGNTKQSLVEALYREEDKIKEILGNADDCTEHIKDVEAQIAHPQPEKYITRVNNAVGGFVSKLRQIDRDPTTKDEEERERFANSYYIANKKHADALDEILDYLITGSRRNKSPDEKSLLRFALNHLIYLEMGERRQSESPRALHGIEIARTLAKQGESIRVLIPSLWHDEVEEHTDGWVKSSLAPGIIEGEMPERVASAYHDQASAIFYNLGLQLYSHAQLLEFPGKYNQTLVSVMDVIESLSRTSDVSYYTYLRHLLYPKDKKVEKIDRQELIRHLGRILPDIEVNAKLDDFVNEVANFFTTKHGGRIINFEDTPNTLRAILVKLSDRLHNTRDVKKLEPFKRIYEVGYKNAYFIQEVEDKMAEMEIAAQSEKVIDKLIMKLKVCALQRMLIEQANLSEKVNNPSITKKINTNLAKYMESLDFHRVTKKRAGSEFDGIIQTFNSILLGNDELKAEIKNDPVALYKYATVWRGVFEEHIIAGAAGRRFKIDGMDHKLEKNKKKSDPPIFTKSFWRDIS